MTTIECCMINRLNGSDAVMKKLEKEAEVITFSCIGNCHICSEKYHAIVEETRVVAEQPTELSEKIIQMLKERV